VSRLLPILVMLAITAAPASAHEVRPAYLQLRQTEARTWDILWKVPGLGPDMRLSLQVRLPQSCAPFGPPRRSFAGGAFVDRWTVRCGDDLAGQEIRIDGLAATLTDVLVRVERLDGTTQVVRLSPSSPSFVVEAAPRPMQVAASYLTLGIEHILRGVDHLLFVLALLMLVRGWRRVVATITAFTVAHSMTLAAATLGLVHVPSRPVEATIALSIVFVAAEIVHAHQGRSGLTERWPWLVALAFGLLHGFGFAGALSDVGLPPGAIPVALLCFNVGVEVGQLIFIAGVFAALIALRPLAARMTGTPAGARRAWPLNVAAYAIGAMAMYWVIERTVSMWA